VALAVAEAASGNGAKLIYSPGVRTQEGVRTLEKIMSITDFLVVDRIELMNLYEADDEEEVLKVVNERHPRMTVVATLGSGGCSVARDGLITRVPGVDISSLGKKVVNTTGCGDAFLGVFASYLHTGCSPLESAVWANLAGALKATRLETRGSPTRNNLEIRMRQLGRIKPGLLGVRKGRSG
jgi:ribokinase